MPWQTFYGRSKPSSKAAHFAIQRKGIFTMNEAAFKALGEPAAVEILWDPERTLIGFRPIEENQSHAYPVRRQGKSTTYTISAKAFFAAYDIPLGTLQRFDPETIDGVLAINLNANKAAPKTPESRKVGAARPAS